MKEKVIVFVPPDSLAEMIIKSFGSWEGKENVDRFSDSFAVARSNVNPQNLLTVSVVERKAGLIKDDCHYLVHIADDLLGECWDVRRPEHFTANALTECLREILYILHYATDKKELMVDRKCNKCVHGYWKADEGFHSLCGADRCYNCQLQYGGGCPDYEEGDIPSGKERAC